MGSSIFFSTNLKMITFLPKILKRILMNLCSSVVILPCFLSSCALRSVSFMDIYINVNGHNVLLRGFSYWERNASRERPGDALRVTVSQENKGRIRPAITPGGPWYMMCLLTIPQSMQLRTLGFISTFRLGNS